MKIVITGASSGIGLATVKRFLHDDHEVHGIDIQDNPLPYCDNYIHHKVDITKELPDIPNVNVLINNAGVQNTGRDIEVNLIGLIAVTRQYGIQPEIRSILNLASVSAHTGAEFPEYTASKGGVLAYTKNVAKQIAAYKATCNSISFGGVYTSLNDPVIEDEAKWQAIMNETPLRRWTTVDEAATWIHFLTVINHSATAQDFIVDNGEFYNHTFVWD